MSETRSTAALLADFRDELFSAGFNSDERWVLIEKAAHHLIINNDALVVTPHDDQPQEVVWRSEGGAHIMRVEASANV